MAVMYFLILHSIQYQNSIEEKILPKKTTKKYIVLANNDPKGMDLLDVRIINHKINNKDLYVVPIFARTGDLEIQTNFVNDIKGFLKRYDDILSKTNVIVVFIDRDEVRMYRKSIIEQIYTDKIGNLFVITPDHNLQFNNKKIKHILYNPWIFMNWNPVDEKAIKKVYINMTRRPRIHRCLLLQQLIQKDLMKFGYNTWHGSHMSGTPDTGDADKTKFLEVFHYDNYDVLDYAPTTKVITHYSPENAHKESFISLVSEHYITTEVCFITEKIYRPIIHQMPFMILGQPGVLDVLKSHGYLTFSNWIDESYDKENDLQKRINLIVQNIENLSKYSINDLIKIRQEMSEVCLANYQNWIKEKAATQPKQIWNKIKSAYGK